VQGGLQVWDVAANKRLMLDPDYASEIQAIAFGADGALYAASWDGFLRRYDTKLRLTAKVKTPSGVNAYSLAVDPTGRKLAVGHIQGSSIDIFDAATLSWISSADVRGLSGDGQAVAWTAGRGLFAGGRYTGSGGMLIRNFDSDGRRIDDIETHTGDTITFLYPCGESLVFGSAIPSFGLVDANGTARILRGSVAPDMRDKTGYAFAVAPDGARLRFGLEPGGQNSVSVDLIRETVTEARREQLMPDLSPAKLSGVDISGWRGGKEPTVGKRRIALGVIEWARALAVRPDAQGFMLGADWSLNSFTADGRLRWKIDPGSISGVNLANNGDLVIAAVFDGTIRWYRWSDGKELLTLFVSRDDLRWVAWTPKGYYMASPGGEDLFGWHLNRGWDQPADFFPASRFRERFNRPDIVKLVLATLDEDKAIRQANEAARLEERTEALIVRLPPVVRIMSPAEGSTFSGRTIDIGYTLRSPSGLKVDRIDVLLDGRPVTEAGRDTALVETGSLSVGLPPRDVEIALIARAGDLTSEPARLRLKWAGQTVADIIKPNLYAVVVGVSDYVEPAFALNYAAKDASVFADLVARQQGGIYGSTEVRLLTDREATRPNIMEALQWLERQVTSRDVGVVFLAGHGITDERLTYWFMPADATPQTVRLTAVSQDDVRRTLQNLAGKALLFLDTCYSGQLMADGVLTRGLVDINSVINEFSSAENGVVAFSSSTGRQLSQESTAWGHGAFTKALVEGIGDGQADLLGNGTITLSELDAFVVNRVKTLTGGIQHPVMARPPTIPDFPIAVVGR
jgi:WD40 repeat protein